MGFLDADVLAELTDEDPSFRVMQPVLFYNDYEGSAGLMLISSLSGSVRVDGGIGVDNQHNPNV